MIIVISAYPEIKSIANSSAFDHFVIRKRGYRQDGDRFASFFRRIACIPKRASNLF